MKIRVPSIPEEGKSFQFDETTPWFSQLLSQRLPPAIFLPGSKAAADVKLFRTHQNVTVSGDLSVPLQPTCSCCAQSFSSQLEVPFQWHMTPYFEDPRQKKIAEGDEIELDADDLGFGFYHHEEIDLAQLISEELLLALPLRFVCQESCRGLCPHCGINLNHGSCDCDKTLENSPFATLKSFKVKP